LDDETVTRYEVPGARPLIVIGFVVPLTVTGALPSVGVAVTMNEVTGAAADDGAVKSTTS